MRVNHCIVKTHLHGGGSFFYGVRQKLDSATQFVHNEKS